MATLTLKDAQDLSQRRRPWTLRLNLTSPKDGYVFTGRAQDEPVEMYHVTDLKKPAKVGTWDWAEDAIQGLLSQGYSFAWTPYKEVSKETIRQHVKSIQTKAVPAKPPGQKLPANPFSRVTALQALSRDSFGALDKDGTQILTLTAKGARTLCQRNPQITIKGLT